MLVTKDLILTYKNELSKSIDFSFFSPYNLISVEEELTNNINTTKQNLIHGTTYISSTLGERLITISGFLVCNKHTKDLRIELIKVFNPTLKGKLIAKNEKSIKEIDVIIEKVPEPKEDNGVISFNIDLIANKPFWNEREKAEYLALLKPMLAFPLAIPKNKGIVFGKRKPVLESIVNNIGDVESGFKVVFKAKGGSVTNPKIYDIYNNKFIKINYVMEKGDILEIISYPESKKITLNGTENAFKYLDMDSDFFNLKIGDNKLGYSAKENTINLDVILWYSPRYLGV